MPQILAAILPAAVSGLAGAAGGVLAQKAKTKGEKELATINRTPEGGVDFASEMANSPNLTLANNNPLLPKKPNLSMLKGY